MNEKKFIIYLYSMFAVMLIFAGAFIIRSEIYKRQLECARAELEQVRRNADELAERQCAIDRNIERAREIIIRQSASVGSSFATISELREGIAEIRKYTEMLEDCLRSYDSSFSSNNNNFDRNNGE